MYPNMYGSYLDTPTPFAPMPSAPCMQPPCAPPAYADVVQPWIVPTYKSNVVNMGLDGAYRYVKQANAKLGGDQKTFTGVTDQVLDDRYNTVATKLTHLRDLEKTLFEVCIAKYAQCRKTPDTNAVFTRGNLVEMAQLCHDLKQ
jgi:hypothetical protein